MASRLSKEINHERRVSYQTALEKWKKKNSDDDTTCEVATDDSGHNNLPRPANVISNISPYTNTPRPTLRQLSCNGPIIKSSIDDGDENDCRMMDRHCLWIRIFDKDDNPIFNHSHEQHIHTSQMVQMCTKLVNHLNLIAQTGEIGIQKALGTFESSITAQLILPFDANYQSSSWNDMNPGKNKRYYSIDAIAIITQNENDIYEGILVDDYIGTTFQL